MILLSCFKNKQHFEILLFQETKKKEKQLTTFLDTLPWMSSPPVIAVEVTGYEVTCQFVQQLTEKN